MQPRKIRSNQKPSSIQKLGNGTYYYNYGIEEVLVNVQDMEGNPSEETQYEFVQALISGQPNYKDCVKGIIRQFISSDDEFDLINSYNSYTQGINDDSSVVEEYKDYLNTLKEIKTNIKKDFV